MKTVERETRIHSLSKADNCKVVDFCSPAADQHVPLLTNHVYVSVVLLIIIDLGCVVLGFFVPI